MFIRAMNSFTLLNTKTIEMIYYHAIQVMLDDRIIKKYYVFADKKDKENVLLATVNSEEECFALMNSIVNFLKSDDEYDVLDLQEKIREIQKVMKLQISEITLLSSEEYKTFQNNIKPINEGWWLRSHSFMGHIMKNVVDIVSYKSDSDTSGYVDGDFNVRPALRVKNLDFEIGSSFEFAGYTWTVISNELVLCDKTIGSTEFRKDRKKEDSNEYASSDIKKWLKKWADEHDIHIIKQSDI